MPTSLRRALEADHRANLAALLRPYERHVLRQIEPELAALEALAEEVDVSADLVASPELFRLQEALDPALTEYLPTIRTQADAMQDSGIRLGLIFALAMLRQARLDAPQAPDNAVLTQRIGYSRSPQFLARLDALPSFYRQLMRDVVLHESSLGRGPLWTAQRVRRLTGMPYQDAVRMTRTAQLYSARSVTQVTYQRNGVEQWRWIAAFDDRVCPSCLAMHGTLHPATEPLNDHFMGRCAMQPLTTYNQDDAVVTGEQWVEQLEPARARRILGNARYNAWQDGAVSFDQFSAVTRNDPLYGEMRGSPSLTALLGARTAAQYK